MAEAASTAVKAVVEIAVVAVGMVAEAMVVVVATAVEAMAVVAARLWRWRGCGCPKAAESGDVGGGDMSEGDRGSTPQASLSHAGTSKPYDTRRRLATPANAYYTHNSFHTGAPGEAIQTTSREEHTHLT